VGGFRPGFFFARCILGCARRMTAERRNKKPT
jgi:hypothetical protein